MAKIQFLGRVLPQVYQVQMEPYEVRWNEDTKSGSREATFKVRIGNSIVNIEVETNRLDPSDISELWKQALDLARAGVNLLAFGSGLGFTVVLETLIDINGQPSALLLADENLRKLCTAFEISEAGKKDFATVQQMVLSDPALFRTLNDLVECLTMTHVSVVNCGRVVDSIRRMISPTLEGPAAWEAMHAALNVARPYQEWISKQSAGPRHADPGFVPGTITTEIAKRTWSIMNRFFEYRKRKNQPLVAPEFPTLQ